MIQIIKSVLDTDLYKLTQQFFVIQHYPDVDVEYTFSNRDKSMKFNYDFLSEFYNQIKLLSIVRLSNEEHDWVKETLSFLPVTYRQYLSSYRFNPDQVFAKINDDGELYIDIKGKWRDTILWEVPLMAIISELYFKMIDTNWTMHDQENKMFEKGRTLSTNKCKFADFGTRRRRSYETQDLLVKTLSHYRSGGFVGTSNPHLAMKYDLNPIGTCAHEAIAGVAALDSLNHPNKVFMEKWTQTYGGRLGIMLPDTFGTDSFLKDFSIEKAKLWDGVRHDSGDPLVFKDKIIDHYKKLNIDTRSKTIVFSDSLTTKKACDIGYICRKSGVQSSFGIGTHFTNDFCTDTIPYDKKSKPLNMVIKLTKADGIPVVKLSDTPEKSIGDPKMVDVMKYIHNKI